MPYEQITDGLTITVPTSGTQSWGQTLKQLAWEPISGHDHTGGGNGTKIGSGALDDNAVTSAKIADNAVTSAKLADNIASTQASTLTPAGTTETINFNNGNKQVLDLSSATGTVTLTFSNPISGADYRIKIIEGATVRTLVWPANVKWPQGVEPSQFFEASTTNMVWLDYDGTNYLASWDLNLS